MKTGRANLPLLATAALSFAATFIVLEDRPKAAPSAPAPVPATVPPVAPVDPVVSALANGATARSLRDYSTLWPLLAGLDAAQVTELLKRVERLPRTRREKLLPVLLRWWTKKDPAAASAWFAPHLAEFRLRPPYVGFGISNSQQYEGDLLCAWAESAPDRALALAREWAGSPLEDELLKLAISAWPDVQPKARLALLRDFPEGKGRRIELENLLTNWAIKDLPAALAAAHTLPPGPGRRQALQSVLEMLALKEPVAGLAEAAKAGLTGEPDFGVVLASATQVNAALTARWLLAQDAGVFEKSATTFVNCWVEKDAVAALAWARKHGVSGAAAFEKALEGESRKAVLDWSLTLPAGPERDRRIEVALQSFAATDNVEPLFAALSPATSPLVARDLATRLVEHRSLRAALDWVQRLPPGPMRELAWQGIGNTDAAALPSIGGETARSPLALPPGPERDAFLAGQTTQRSKDFYWSKTLEESAFGLLPAIGDATLRRQAFDAACEGLARNGSEEIREARVALLERAPVAAEWKAPWLEKFRTRK